MVRTSLQLLNIVPKKALLYFTSLTLAVGAIIGTVASQPAHADTVQYGKGVYQLSAPLVIPDGYSLVGAGVGQTILQAAPGYSGVLVQSSGSLDSKTAGMHHPGIQIHDITIDGNGTASRGIYLSSVDNLVIENVEAENTTGNAIEQRGTENTAYTETQTWQNVTAHDCGGWGVYNGLRTRKVSYVNIKVNNCANGMTIDHSEAQLDGLQVTNNKGDGLWIRNVFAVDLSDIRATGNGRYGIHVQGMVNSVGTSWLSENNKSIDVWFDGSAPLPSFNYGVTRGTAITGLVIGGGPFQLGNTGAGETPLTIDQGVAVSISNQVVIGN